LLQIQSTRTIQIPRCQEINHLLPQIEMEFLHDMREYSFIVKIDGFGAGEFIGFGTEIRIQDLAYTGEEVVYPLFEDLQVEEAAEEDFVVLG
jgi:hypothetical protein